MADFGGTILTKKGFNLIAKGLTGATIEFTKVQLGDGVWDDSVNPEQLTSLVSPKLDLPIQELKVVGDGTARLRFVLTNTGLGEGFFIREIGIFANDPDEGEILYAVTYAENADFIPADGVTKIEDVTDIYTVVSNAQNVTAVISDTVILATKQDIDTKISEHDQDPNAHQDIRAEIKVAGTPILKPAILQPANGTKDFLGVVQSSQYSTKENFYGPHESSDWEISSDRDFQNVVASSYEDTTNLTSLDVSQFKLDPSTEYFIRVRYRSMGHMSQWSDPVSFTTPANQPPDVTNLKVEGFPTDDNGNLYIVQNQSLQVDFTGAVDPDGDPITYEITDAGILVPSKTSSIADGEKITVTAPSVDNDTSSSISVIARDDKGASSPVKVFNILVKKVAFGVVDIFGDDSCIVYMPLKENEYDLAGLGDIYKYGCVQFSGNEVLIGNTNCTNSDGNWHGYIAFNNTSSVLTNPISFSIKFRSSSGSGAILGINDDTYSGDNAFNSYAYLDNNYIKLGLYTTYYSINFTRDDNWHHLAFIYDQSGNKAWFLDGQQVASRSDTDRYLTTGAKIMIGAMYDPHASTPINTYLSDSYIKNFRVFNKILSSEEISYLMEED